MLGDRYGPGTSLSRMRRLLPGFWVKIVVYRRNMRRHFRRYQMGSSCVFFLSEAVSSLSLREDQLSAIKAVYEGRA